MTSTLDRPVKEPAFHPLSGRRKATNALATVLVSAAVLIAQILLVRPALTRRSDQVLAGSGGPRSRAHYVYVALELVKVVALVFGGVLLLL